MSEQYEPLSGEGVFEGSKEGMVAFLTALAKGIEKCQGKRFRIKFNLSEKLEFQLSRTEE